MKNQWSQFPFVLRRKILLTFLAGIASIAVSLVIFTVAADRILLVLGGFIFAASLVLGSSLWRTAARDRAGRQLILEVHALYRRLAALAPARLFHDSAQLRAAVHGEDVLPVRPGGEVDAGVVRLPVDEHRAGPALSYLTALFHRSKAKISQGV